MGTVLPIFFVIGAGFIGQRKLKLNLSAIARLGLYILSPCLAFSSLTHSQLTPGNAFGVIAVILSVTLLLYIVGSLTGRWLGFTPERTSALLLSTLFTNAGNYGVPLMDLAFGSVSRDLAVIAFVTQQVLFNTLAVWLANRGRLTWRQGIGQVLRMPVTYAVSAALIVLFTGFKTPDPLDKSITMLANAALPVVLLSLGLQLADTRPDLGDAPPMGVAVLYRLVLSPALAVAVVCGLAPLFGMSGLAAKVAIVALSMPTAVTIVLMSIEFKADSKFVAAVVFFSTLASALTLTVILTLLI